MQYLIHQQCCLGRPPGQFLSIHMDSMQVTAGNDVNLTGFGSWKRTERAARSGRNPKTGKCHSTYLSYLAPFS